MDFHRNRLPIRFIGALIFLKIKFYFEKNQLNSDFPKVPSPFLATRWAPWSPTTSSPIGLHSCSMIILWQMQSPKTSQSPTWRRSANYWRTSRTAGRSGLIELDYFSKIDKFYKKVFLISENFKIKLVKNQTLMKIYPHDVHLQNFFPKIHGNNH